MNDEYERAVERGLEPFAPAEPAPGAVEPREPLCFDDCHDSPDGYCTAYPGRLCELGRPASEGAPAPAQEPTTGPCPGFPDCDCGFPHDGDGASLKPAEKPQEAAASPQAVPVGPSVPLILDSEIENAVDRIVAKAETIAADLTQARAELETARRERDEARETTALFRGLSLIASRERDAALQRAEQAERIAQNASGATIEQFQTLETELDAARAALAEETRQAFDAGYVGAYRELTASRVDRHPASRGAIDGAYAAWQAQRREGTGEPSR